MKKKSPLSILIFQGAEIPKQFNNSYTSFLPNKNFPSCSKPNLSHSGLKGDHLSVLSFVCVCVLERVQEFCLKRQVNSTPLRLNDIILGISLAILVRPVPGLSNSAKDGPFALAQARLSISDNGLCESWPLPDRPGSLHTRDRQNKPEKKALLRDENFSLLQI